MKETKQASGQPEARDVVREMMAAFEAFKGANDARLGEIEKKAAADVLLEEKVARIDQAVVSAQARLDRVMSQSRRPAIGGELAEPTSAPEAKAAWDGYLKTGQSPHLAGGLEVKAGLSGGATSGGYVVPYETERAIERRLMAASPMREIATVRTVAAGVFRKPVSTAGVACGWVAETAARPETDPATLALLEFPSADLYANPAATQALLDDAMVDLDEWLAAEVEDVFAAQETHPVAARPPSPERGGRIPNLTMEIAMAQPVTVAEAKLFLRVEHEVEDGLIQTLIAAAQAKVEGDVGLSLTSTSPAPLRLAILMLVLRAYERGEAVEIQPVEGWIAPYRVVRL